ncbi:hypothetical protein [Bradyrhizobium roseum]|uniref:hypothetical protein n=1 Tax=Bradyrhizobium roseum TaxID=3056648 RepID=UPI0026205EAF|nr:hypothetical protein [Bradyrhizobium roseus]WKA30548.1 hypothetical protein QUH67_10440 [Bradyrhizobium roseus]
MASESENSVSVELGELLKLLNALDAQDSRPLENFATLERLLAAGKAGSADPSSDHHQFDDDQSGVETQSRIEPDVDGGIPYAGEPSSSEALIAQRPEQREDERPEAEIENRLAVHIIQGLRKSIMDRTS